MFQTTNQFIEILPSYKPPLIWDFPIGEGGNLSSIISSLFEVLLSPNQHTLLILSYYSPIILPFNPIKSIFVDG